MKVSATEEPLHILFAEAPRLNESVAWGGSIVMKTGEELQKAFMDLRSGDFIKDRLEGI